MHQATSRPAAQAGHNTHNGRAHHPGKKAQAPTLQDAVAELLRRVRAGGEFPDAAWSVAQVYGVDQSKLEAAYDLATGATAGGDDHQTGEGLPC